MKNLLITLLMLIPFGLLAELPIIEPELYSNQNLKHIGERLFTEHNGLVYVNADDGEHGEELWVFDGATKGIRMLMDINPLISSKPVIVNNELDNFMLFVADDNSKFERSVASYNGLWATNGTEEGTTKIFNGAFNTTIFDSGKEKENERVFYKLKDKIYFFSDVPEQNFPMELWCTDGTKEGTHLVKRFNYTFPQNINVINERIIFFNDIGPFTEVWSSDGTTENTNLIHKIENLISDDVKVVNNKILFYNYTSKRELWVTDGTQSGTFRLDSLIEDIYNPREILIQSDKFYFFSSFSQDSILSLWRTDGTINGTKMLVDLTALDEWYYESAWNYNDLGGYYYFSTENMKSQIKSLWCTDGTKNGTKIIYSEVENEDVVMSFAKDDGLYYLRYSGNPRIYNSYYIKGYDLNSIQILYNINISYPNAVIGNRLLFNNLINDDTVKQWVTDGTNLGTKELNKHITLNKHISISKTSKFNDQIYFQYLDESDNKYKLIKTDLTTDGTYQIKPSNHQIYNFKYSRQILHNLNHQIYFFADYYGEGQQLYRIPNTVTSVEETEQPELMTLYPNPAKDYIQLELDKPMQLSIVNSTGAKVKDYGIVVNGKLNVAELTTGVYFVVDEQGKNIAKFVKE